VEGEEQRRWLWPEQQQPGHRCPWMEGEEGGVAMDRATGEEEVGHLAM
jgi:hypothetical protein